MPDAAVAVDAPIEDRFQGLVDRGLLNDPPKQEPAPQPTPQSSQPEAAQADEPVTYANLDDYLQKAGMERESFLSLPVRLKVDGSESDVPLNDLIRTAQTDRHVTQKSQALADAQRAWETEQTQVKQALAQQWQNAQALGTLAHQQLMGQYQNVDWNRLRQEDPQQYLLANQDFQARNNQIQTYMMQLQQHQAQQLQQQQSEQAKFLETERSKMLEQFPEWRDTSKFQAAKTELSAYARSQGFQEAELAGIFDHRYMKVLHDASRYAALQAKESAALKQVRAAPPMAAPGSRTQSDPKVVAYQDARKRMNANPRDEDAQAAAFGSWASSNPKF